MMYLIYGRVTPLSNELVEGVSIDDVPAVRLIAPDTVFEITP
jgi:hypothetical protein